MRRDDEAIGVRQMAYSVQAPSSSHLLSSHFISSHVLSSHFLSCVLSPPFSIHTFSVQDAADAPALRAPPRYGEHTLEVCTR